MTFHTKNMEIGKLKFDSISTIVTKKKRGEKVKWPEKKNIFIMSTVHQVHKYENHHICLSGLELKYVNFWNTQF